MTTEVVCGSATKLDMVADGSVACVVTSPPYNCGVPYDGYDDLMTWHDYMLMTRDAAEEMYRVLVGGGRVWVNVPPAVPEPDHDARVDLEWIWKSSLRRAGFQYRDTIVWKQNSHDGGTAWGSWLSPSAPNIRGEWESIISMFKGEWKRNASTPGLLEQPRMGLGGDWTDMVRNVWDLPSVKRLYSAAPFPIELPARCIRLSTWPGETVLDPFGGGGTTAEAADLLGRHGISVDISAHQTAVTNDRLTTLFGGPA